MKLPSLFLILLCCAALATPVASQTITMRAATTPTGPGLRVVLSWPANSPTQHYNLYRKIAAAASYPSTPLNAQPLGRPMTCAALEAIIPRNSEEWGLIVNGLSPAGAFNPCQILTLGAGTVLEENLQIMARTRWRIAMAIGQGYDDTAVVNGTAYEYELRAVNAVGNETEVLSKTEVTAGVPKPLPAPDGLTATAGDSRVLVLWGRQSESAGFVVLRAPAAGGPYLRVNETSFQSQIKQDLDGIVLNQSSNGFLDIQRWDADGTPSFHLVNGNRIDGPANGTTYYYKVASLDLLGQAGPASATAVAATPTDKTPPMAPTGVAVTAVDSESRLEVRWSVTNLDANGHLESAPIAGYRLYRYEAENAPINDGMPIGAVILAPPLGKTYQTASDTDPILRPPYGEKTYWYRVEAEDAAGNRSARSVAVGGHLTDITPPAPPSSISAVGYDNYIQVQWSPNTERDLDGYLVYRSLCHKNVAKPCDPQRPDDNQRDPQRSDTARPDDNQDDNKKVPCTGEYLLVGSVSKKEANVMGNTVTFDDRTLPAGSPLCYSYWIKAFDRAQNKSGSWPFPSNSEQTVCQRLRDTTPPEPAIISALLARDRAIRIEWVGPPVQDIRAYHVYRSDTESGSYAWVGGMTVEPPPALPTAMTAPYKGANVGCTMIPLTIIDSMSMGYFVDTQVEAKSIYWYKVVGIDQSGNEALLKQATPISTFNFTTQQPMAPVITSITASTTSPLALIINWTPVFNPAQIKGFALFRSDKFDGLYRQVGTLLTKAEYQDTQVVKGVTYWYKVVQMDATGQLSPPSTVVSGLLTQ